MITGVALSWIHNISGSQKSNYENEVTIGRFWVLMTIRDGNYTLP